MFQRSAWKNIGKQSRHERLKIDKASFKQITSDFNKNNRTFFDSTQAQNQEGPIMDEGSLGTRFAYKPPLWVWNLINSSTMSLAIKPHEAVSFNRMDSKWTEISKRNAAS